VYPSPTPAQRRSSEPSKESLSDSENKPNSSLLTENRTKNSLEDIASNTEELVRLTTDFGIETCVLCGFKGRMDWQATLHDGSWGLLCADCGCKLAKKMREVE
jgi:hypothetical protein